eukprot:6989488-Prymnesium_polylepis.1
MSHVHARHVWSPSRNPTAVLWRRLAGDGHVWQCVNFIIARIGIECTCSSCSLIDLRKSVWHPSSTAVQQLFFCVPVLPPALCLTHHLTRLRRPRSQDEHHDATSPPAALSAAWRLLPGRGVTSRALSRSSGRSGAAPGGRRHGAARRRRACHQHQTPRMGAQRARAPRAERRSRRAPRAA